MKEDLKIFLKYILSFKGFAESFHSELRKVFEPKTFSSILFFIAIYLLLKLPSPDNRYASAFLISVALLLQLRLLYKGGDHRRWWRKKNGILSKKELLRLEHTNIPTKNKIGGKSNGR